MIASLEGKVASLHADHLIIVVNGVGYKVFAPSSSLSRIESGDSIYLNTLLVVREDSLTLYGFLTTAEREIFEKLTNVSGVGPKTALAILSGVSLDALRNAVVAERPELLTRAKGVSTRLAQKIVLELKGKLAEGLDGVPASALDDVNSDVLDTLVALGYSIAEAQSAIQALPADAPHSVEERVRLALQYFA